MKIALTGSSGGLGSLLLDDLKRKHEVVTLGRENCDVSWALGEVPSPEEMQGIEALIHCAWSTKDRKQDFHMNVVGTLSLARFAETNVIPFLFISSVAALSDSYYGIAKREAEVLVEQQHGSSLRIGLVPQSNPYLDENKKFLGLTPSFPGCINLTEFQMLSSAINTWTEEIHAKDFSPGIKTSISSSVEAKEQFLKQYRHAIPIPMWILRVILVTSKRVTLKAANLLDALNSLNTTPRILP